jgi:hypothetical protein
MLLGVSLVPLCNTKMLKRLFRFQLEGLFSRLSLCKTYNAIMLVYYHDSYYHHHAIIIKTTEL